MKRYTHIVLRRMPPLNGFSIKTPEAKFLSDIRPRGIVRELNRLNDRIKRLEDSYAAKDKQLSNLLHICRDNDIEVSSYDLIHRKEAKL